MWTRNKSKLADAVGRGDVTDIRHLVEEGENIMQRIDTWLHERATLLHIASDVPTIKVLIGLGVSINDRDSFGRSPLHSAVELNRHAEVVREFLRQGVAVDLQDLNKFTALNYAVNKFFPDHDVIRVLLEHGAKIDSDETGVYPPLFHAMNKLPVAKLLVKVYLLFNFNENYKSVIDLSPYVDRENYHEVADYLKTCEYEILLMKAYKVTKTISLYTLMASRNIIAIPLSAGNQILSKVRDSESYCIYRDMVVEKVYSCIERAMLLLKLEDMPIFTILSPSERDKKGRKVYLDSDSSFKIAEYLTNDSLRNFVDAYNF